MEDKLDVLSNKIDNLIDRLDCKYADREQFLFWRNILVGGILVAIFIGVISLWFKK